MDDKTLIQEEVDQSFSDGQSDSDEECLSKEKDGDIDIVTCGISESEADFFYNEAGTEVEGNRSNDQVIVLPNPSVLHSSDEMLILEAKESLKVQFELEYFQVQALLGRVKTLSLFYLCPPLLSKNLHALYIIPFSDKSQNFKSE